MFWSPLQQQAFEEMNSHSRLISQYKLLLDIWPGAGFDGHSTVERAWPALQERVLEPPVLADWLVVLDKSFLSSGAQASVLSCYETGQEG